MTTSSNPAGELLDARGVPIAPGDTALYGFTVGRSVAMAEAVVLGDGADGCDCRYESGDAEDCRQCYPKVSLTREGRVRLRIVRRSYRSGSKPIVDVAPDRLVVLKANDYPGGLWPYLPPSPLPTQDEEVRNNIQRTIDTYTEELRKPAPDRWEDLTGPAAQAAYYAWVAKQLAHYRSKLKALDDA